MFVHLNIPIFRIHLIYHKTKLLFANQIAPQNLLITQNLNDSVPPFDSLGKKKNYAHRVKLNQEGNIFHTKKLLNH